MASVEFRLAELERRLANLARIGVVEELDEASARVRVRCGELLTGWLPWLTRRAGGDADWWAPEPGEQVLVISPFGDPALGLALPALYQDTHPAPAGVKTVRRVTFADGTVIEYDRAGSKLSVNCVGSAAINATGPVTVDAPEIHHNQGAGVVTTAHICHFTGAPHGDGSSTVTAGA